MIKPQKPPDEALRLSNLKSLHLLDTPINKSFERITRLTKALFNIPIVAISLIDDERQWFKSIQGLDVCETSREVSFCGHTILQEELFIINDALKDQRFADNPLVIGEPHIRFYAGYPVKSKQGFKIGTLCIIDRVPRTFTAEELRPLKDMAALVEEELNNQKQNHTRYELINELDEAKRNSLIDPLTRIWNRRGIKNLLIKHISFCRTNKKHFGLALIDIDNFKHINDTYGHSAGDYVLCSITKLLLNSLRETDSIGRWGGEEFLIIIDIDDKKRLLEIIERARENICSTMIPFEENDIAISFTAGLRYVSPSKSDDLNELISQVDKGLYLGKENGKNKVVLV